MANNFADINVSSLFGGVYVSRRQESWLAYDPAFAPDMDEVQVEEFNVNKAGDSKPSNTAMVVS